VINYYNHRKGVHKLAYIPETKTCISCAIDNMQIWSIADGKTMSSFQFSQKINDCAVYNSNNLCFVSGSAMYFYDIK
jgi:WD40 repeat protein